MSSFDLVTSYSRSLAIEAGRLVDVSEQASEAGHPYPTAVTREVWEAVVEPARPQEQCLMAVLAGLTDAVVRLGLASMRPHFDVLVVRNGRTIRTRLVGEYGSDEGRPVITIMMPWEVLR